MNFLLERQKVRSTIKLTVETIINRLLASFEGLENEIEEMYDKIQFESEEQYIDDVWHTRERHLQINNAMKQELLNNACVWLFHLFEKDCTTIFNTENGKEKKEHLEELGVSTGVSSAWRKINKELRLVANAVKHGEGSSCEKLREIRPDLFNDTELFFSRGFIKIDLIEFKNYSKKIHRILPVLPVSEI